MKNLLTLTATVTALAGLAVLVALVLFVIPGGLGILTIEFERATRWFRQARKFLWRTKPTPKEEWIPC